MGDTSMK